MVPRETIKSLEPKKQHSNPHSNKSELYDRTSSLNARRFSSMKRRTGSYDEDEEKDFVPPDV